jgi:arylsulfatase A-like enzyme
MKRREFLAGVTAAAGAMAIQKSIGATETPRRPNLVYVFADQLRYSSCGYAGDEFARTPNIDRLASEGCNFHQAVSSTPVCAPYRCSLMTGKYQSSTGMVINELRLSPEHECFGHALSKAGYKTGYIGKWHMWANQLGHHELIKNGFVPPGPYRLGFDDFWAAYNFNHVYYRSPYFLDDPTPHIRTDYEPDGQTNMAIDFLKKASRKTEPFALFLSWGPPHLPWNWDNVDSTYADLYRNIDLPLAPNYSGISDPYCDDWQKLPPDYDTHVKNWMRIYYAQTANLDWNLGRLMKALEETGQAENTIVVFTSDHGEMFGSHGRQAKLIFYEEAARIPFLVRWPSRIRPKTVSDALLGTPDIMPTLLSMMNVGVPQAVEGIDLSSHAVGKGGTDNDAAYLQGMGATASWAEGTEWRALRDHEYTYAIYHKDGKELLFNHRIDPYQLIDLASERSATNVLTHYRQMSEKWRQEHNDRFEASGWYQRNWTEDRNITMTATGVKQDLEALHQINEKWFPNGVGLRSIDIPPVHDI